MTAAVRKPRGPARFREKDVTRVLRAAQRSGVPFAAVKIAPDGSILVIPGEPEPVPPSNHNVWDDD